MIKTLSMVSFVISNTYLVYFVCQVFVHQPIDQGLTLWALGLAIISGSLFFVLDLGERVSKDEYAQRLLAEGCKRHATSDRPSMDTSTPTETSSQGR